jgi:hypothetical protein
MDTSDEFSLSSDNILDMSVDSVFAVFDEIDIAFGGNPDDEEDDTDDDTENLERRGQGPRQQRLE